MYLAPIFGQRQTNIYFFYYYEEIFLLKFIKPQLRILPTYSKKHKENGFKKILSQIPIFGARGIEKLLSCIVKLLS